MNTQERHGSILCIIALIAASFTLGCSKEQAAPLKQDPPVTQAAPRPLDAATREACRKQIAELHIPTYRGASFVMVRPKSKDSTRLVAVYEVPATDVEKTFYEVKDFYEKGLNKALGPKGWTRTQAAGYVIAYRKGLDVFFAEFSIILRPPSTKQIQIELSCGS